MDQSKKAVDATWQKLKYENEILKATLKEVHVVNWTFDIADNAFEFSANPFPLLGISQLHLDFDELLKMVHHKDVMIVRNSLTNYRETYPHSHDFHFRILKTTFKERWLKCTGKLIKGNEKKEYIIGYIQDVTEDKLTKKNLRDTYNRLEVLAENTKEGLIMHDNGLITDANAAVLKIFNIRYDEIVNFHLSKLITTSTKQLNDWLKMDGEILEYEMVSDAQERVVLELSHKKTSNKKYSFILFNNVTKRKVESEKMHSENANLKKHLTEKQKKLQAKEEIINNKEASYQTFLHNLQGMAYRSYVTLNGFDTEYVSDGCLKLTGYTSIEITEADQFFEKKIVNEKYRKITAQLINEALNSNTSFEVTYEITTRDGQNKWAYERGIGIYNAKGEVTGVDGVIVDITTAKEQEKLYRLAKATIDNAPILIEWIREDGSFHYVNNKSLEVSGYTQKEFETLKIYERDRKLSKYEWKNIFNERNVNRVEDLETFYYKKSGNRIPILTSASNINFEGTTYNCAYFTDITELKSVQHKLQVLNEELTVSEEELRQQSEELAVLNEHLEKQKKELQVAFTNLKNTKSQLIQAEKMASLGVLVAGIAHELNNPINYIGSSTEALKIVIDDLLNFVENENEELTKEELLDDVNKMIKNIAHGSRQAIQIIKGLRNFSRLDNELTTKCHLNDCIDNMLILLKNKYDGKIQIIKNYGNIPPLNCVVSQINQVILNLINNAIQAIEFGGTITLTTKCIKNIVSLKIKDSGKGIEKKILNRIFEPFFTTKELGEGTGLGLSISLGIVQDHNGSINVKSSKKGTTFEILLPSTEEYKIN